MIRSGDTNDDLAVDIKITGSASNGVDYALIASTIMIPKGFLAVDIPVNPMIDTANRGNKTVVLAIETNTDYQIGGDHRATVLIIDDVFNTPVPTVTISDPTNDSTFSYPSDITLTADANDPGATITSAALYANVMTF